MSIKGDCEELRSDTNVELEDRGRHRLSEASNPLRVLARLEEFGCLRSLRHLVNILSDSCEWTESTHQC